MSDRRQLSGGASTGLTKGSSSVTVPDTPDIIAARTNQARIDPSIGYRLGEKERQLKESMASPTGGYVTPQIRDAILRSGQRELMQQAGEQTREGAYDVNRLNMQNRLALAGLTKGQKAETASQYANDYTGQVTQKPSVMDTISQIAGLGGSIAPISL